MRRPVGLFGSKKRTQELEAENEELQSWIGRLNGMEPLQLAREIERARADLAAVQEEVKRANGEVASARQELALARNWIVITEETALLQEVGVYEYQHPLVDAVAYKSALADLKDAIKAITKGGDAVLGSTSWQVNGSIREGTKMVRDFSKLMLRAYNAEADNCVRTLRPHRLSSAVERLSKARATIARLGGTMSIQINDQYHALRLHELQLTADYLAKVEEEKERVRAEREHQREEEKARREFEAEKARLLKEQSHYFAALETLRAKRDESGVKQLEAKLEEISASIVGVESREANIRAGYVYIISNLGSFGERMVKIGMTRRLNPTDRVRELGDASVPFRFDVHALVFSDDAVGLESRLHESLSEKRVNRVNLRREFFYATPKEVRSLLEEIAGQHLLEFHEIPEAVEWRASGASTGPAI